MILGVICSFASLMKRGPVPPIQFALLSSGDRMIPNLTTFPFNSYRMHILAPLHLLTCLLLTSL